MAFISNQLFKGRNKSGAREKKLASRISAILLIVVLIVLGVITTVTVISTRGAMMDSAKSSAQALASQNASNISNILSVSYGQAGILSDIFSSTLTLPEKNRAPSIHATLTKVIEKEKSEPSGIFGVFSEWEPNKLAPDTPAAVFYYFLDQNKIGFEGAETYSEYCDSEYYKATKSQNKPILSEPYLYEFDDGREPQWMVTLTAPVRNASGQFIGLVGFDILLKEISSRSAVDSKQFESLYSEIISPKGMISAHSANPKLMGESIELPDMNGTLETEGVSDINKEKTIQIYTPIKVNGIDESWTSLVSIDKGEVLSGANRLTFVIICAGILGIAIIMILVIVIISRSVRPVKEIALAAQRMCAGDFNVSVNYDQDDEIGRTVTAFNTLVSGLRSYIGEIVRLLSEMARGNLNVHAQIEFQGEFIQVQDALRKIIQSLNTMLVEIHHLSGDVAGNAESISSFSQSLASGSSRQAASVEEISATISDLTGHVSSNRDETDDANKIIKELRTISEESNRELHNLLEAMKDIEKASKDVSKVMSTIDDIAFQTNILALNAAVEAARAGSAGKGFAVVADEVRNLANKSAEAADETTVLIQGTVSKVENGKQTAEETAHEILKIFDGINKMDRILDGITESTRQQTNDLEHVDSTIKEVASVVQNNSATSQEGAASSEELSSRAQTLAELVKRFTLRQE